MKPLPLFGNSIQSYSAWANAQRRLNCFYDPRPDGDRDQIIIRGTPGSSLWITLPVAPIRGWKVVQNILYVVARGNFYSVTTAGVVTLRGTLTTTSGRVELQDNGVQIIIVDGTAGWTYTIATTTLAQIVDVNFPNGAATVAFINGRFLVEKAGTRQFWQSALYDGTNWTPATFGTKENESSNIVAVEVTNGNVILWGQSSMEFWQDVGTTPLAYQRISGTTQSWGLAAVASRAVLLNTEIFLGQNPQGHVQVLMLDGYTPGRVSTTDIENIINSFSTYTDAVALTYMLDGHAMYQLTFPTGGRSFLYDATTHLWQEVQTGTAQLARHFGQYGVSFNFDNYISDSTTGGIYKLVQDGYTDNGQVIKRQLRTKHIRMNGNTFGVAELWLDIDTGEGLQAGQGSDPQMMIRVSKDGGRTFGPERTVSMGKVGQYRSPRLITRRWGMARDFVWEFTVTDPVKFLVAGGAAVPFAQEGQG